MMRPLLFKVGAVMTACLALAALLVAVFDNLQVQPDHTYRARFADASGLADGDTVRVAGVTVGRVSSLTMVQPGNQVLVTFTASNAVQLTRDTTLAVRYADVLGNRFLEIDRPVAPAPRLAADTVIPASRTQPALSLDALFNGFQPLFAGLQPAQVNELTTELIRVLQGEGGTIDGLLESIGSLTSTIANRDQLIGQVIGNLNAVLGTVSARDAQLSDFISQLKRLISGLSADRYTIGNSITVIAGATGTIGGLLAQARPGVSGTVTQAGRLSALLNRNSGTINTDLGQVIPKADALMARQGLYGSFFNFYMCAVTIRLSGPSGQPADTPQVTSEAKRCHS
ncbi:MAG: MCE family protein [Streptosporangiales bacterium]|nr:MCE family protein [Streptosporangiales bacterium]